MTHVATLIGAPDALDASTVTRARKMLPGAGEPRWLSPGSAADITFTPAAGDGESAIAQSLRDMSGADAVVQKAANRRKRLFLADMDSTMIGQECIDELAAFVGLKEHVAAITERAMRGEIAFEPALRERVALLEGLPVTTIREVIDRRITLTPGGRTLVATMRANGARACLVSGGFTLFTQAIGAMIGFDDSRGNTLGLDGDRLSGRVIEPIFGREGKRATLIELRTQLGLAKDDTLAIGDGANDMDMIAEAGLGVAFHAKPKVAQAAPARIDRADLTALLYVQGYSRDDFVGE